MKRTTQEIKEILFASSPIDVHLLEQFRGDERKSVQQLVKKYENKLQQENELKRLYKEKNTFEDSAIKSGAKLIAGVDEVGRGPLAGPVVASAVILDPDTKILGLNDSKQLSEKKRETLFEQIQEKARYVGVGIIDEQTIDRVNILEATKMAMLQAIERLPVSPDYLLIDALILDLSIPQEKIIKGDAKSNSIAAASIVAKVTRDRLMQKYSKQYPEYLFEKNAGYGTKAHLEAIHKYGITPIHRKSFEPIKSMLIPKVENISLF